MKSTFVIAALVASSATQALAQDITPLNQIVDHSVWTRPNVTQAEAFQYVEDFGIRCSAIYYSAAKDALATPALNHMAETFTSQASTMMIAGASAIAVRSEFSMDKALKEFAQPRVIYVGNLLQDLKFKERAAHGQSDENSIFWQDMTVCQNYYQAVREITFGQ